MRKFIITLMIIGICLGIYDLVDNKKEKSIDDNIFETSSPLNDSIGIIQLNGTISFNSQGYFERTSTAGKLIKDLDYFRVRDVEGVLIRINSPGGSIGAVQEVCYAMEKFRETGKKIVVSFKDISASGGYYISCFADKIVSNPGTLTGSIGVIMSMPDLSDLFEKLGIKYNTIKSGKFKDIGNMARDMTDDEKDLLQSTVMDSYEQFVEAVSKGRDMDIDEVKKLADGRIFTGRQAKEKGLVDELGGFDKGISVLKEICGIKGNANIKYPGKKNNFMDLINELNN